MLEEQQLTLTKKVKCEIFRKTTNSLIKTRQLSNRIQSTPAATFLSHIP